MTRSTATPSARAPKGPSTRPSTVGTGFPAEDAQNDFARARRSRMLADLGRRLRFEPDDVGYILPFEEVVEALGRVSEHDLGLQTHRARLDRRHRRPHEGVRPRLPPHQPAAEGALAADRRGPAPRRVVPADLRLPHRRAALRARRPPSRVGRALAGPRRHRRVRDRGPDARRPWRRRARLRPADQGPRAPLPRARPARPRAPQPDQAYRSRGTTARSPRASRPGASARCRATARSWTAPRSRGCGSTRTTSRSRRC